MLDTWMLEINAWMLEVKFRLRYVSDFFNSYIVTLKLLLPFSGGEFSYSALQAKTNVISSSENVCNGFLITKTDAQTLGCLHQVGVLLHETAFLCRFFERYGRDLVVSESHHTPKVFFFDQLESLYAEEGGQHTIKGNRCSPTLHMS